MESKEKVKLMVTENRMLVTRAWGWRKEETLFKGYKFSLIRKSSGDLMYSMMIITNNNALYT